MSISVKLTLDQIRTVGDPVLSASASPVTDFDGALVSLAERLRAVCAAHRGLGVAAPQIGVSSRVIVYSVGGTMGVVVNPEVVSTSRRRWTFKEGCLSVPGIALDVVRPRSAVICGFDEFGNPVVFEDDGLLTRVLLHEIDHLDGRLLLDRVDPEVRAHALAIYHQRHD